MTTTTEGTAPTGPAGGEEIPLLRLRGVSKHFGPVQALTDVDLDIPAGQVTALAGDNGAGKSVMIKTISGIHPPDGGQMWWAGKPMHVHTPGEAAALGIETVYQDLALCDNLDIVQNMFLGRERTHRGQLDEESMENSARETLASLAVTTVRSVRQAVASLSGGQRQSVAIAKAVLWNSKLVIMDEPTAALGVAQTAMVLALVRRLADRGSRGDDRLAQHERRLRGGGPDRRAAPRPDGRRAARGRDGPADRRRPHDDGCVDADRTATTGGGVGDVQPQGRNPDARRRDPGELSTRPTGRAPQSADTAGAYLRASLVRIKGGETGILPVVGGLLLVSVLFQVANNHFLTAGNLVNLLVQAAVFSLLAMGEVFALLLGEIDLSTGFVAGLSAVVMAELVQPAHGWPWWAAIARGARGVRLIGLLQGTIITRIGLPSFVVTLAGLLFWQGVMLRILGNGGSIPIKDDIINDIASGTLTEESAAGS